MAKGRIFTNDFNPLRGKNCHGLTTFQPVFSRLTLLILLIFFFSPTLPRAAAEGSENYKVQACSDLIGQFTRTERAKNFVFGRLFKSDRIPQPDITPKVETGEDGTKNISINLGDIQDFADSMTALFEENETLMASANDHRAPLEGSSPKRLGKLESVANKNGYGIITSYFRHRKDDKTTHWHVMNLWKRGKNEEPSEDYQKSIQHLQRIIGEHNDFRRILLTTAIQGFEDGINYHLQRMVEKDKNVGRDFFRTKFNDENGGGPFTYERRGLSIPQVSLKYDHETNRVSLVEVTDVPVYSWTEFEQRKTSLQAAYRRTFGQKASVLENLIQGAKKKGVIGSLVAMFKAPFIGLFEGLKFIATKMWELIINVLHGNFVQIIQGTGDWFLSHFSQGGQLVEISNRQAFLRWRLQHALKAMEKRESDLGIPLTPEEQTIKDNIRESLVNPLNQPSAASVSFAEGLILKDELRVATIKNKVVNGEPLPSENLDKFSNNDFKVEKENVDSATDTRVSERLNQYKAAVFGSMLTLMGFTAIQNSVALSDISFVITESPRISYYRAVVKDWRNQAILWAVGKTPEMQDSAQESQRGWTVTEIVPAHIQERMERFVAESRYKDDSDPSVFFSDEFEEEALRVMRDEFLAIREELNVAVSYTQLRTIFLEKAIPMQILDHMRNAYIERYPAYERQINIIFNGFIEYSFDTNYGSNSVIDARNNKTISSAVYADLRWFFTHGYKSAYNYYLTENWGTLHTDTGGPYESFGQAPSLLHKVESETVIRSYPGEDERFVLYSTIKTREVFVLNDLPDSPYAQIAFADADLPEMDASFFFVLDEAVIELESEDEVTSEEANNNGAE